MKDYILKPNDFYLTLKNPKFVGQSKCDKNGDYIMVFSEDGKKYGFKHNICG